jgi:Spy/CpxP family protein refolding chaperone
MATQTTWIFAAALALSVPAAAPASASCGMDPAEQVDQRAGKPESDKDRPKPKDEHGPFKFWQGDVQAELGISNQQSAEIEQIFQATMPKLEATKEKLDKLEATLSQTIRDNTADLATVAMQVDRQESTRAELYKTRTLMLYRMRLLLTPEQRARLQARWEARNRKQPEQTGRR